MKKQVLIYGLIAGVLIAILGYLSMQGVFSSMRGLLYYMVVIVLTNAAAGLAYRRANEGYASFGELLQLFIGVILVALLVSGVYSMITLSTMSDETKTEMVDRLIDEQMDMYKGVGMDEEQLTEMEEAMADQYDDVFTPSKYLMGSMFNFVIFFLISLIPALIIRKGD